MRTKTLLLTAALSAAGVATSMAQVYSVNAVGYVNTTLVPGLNLISNPLIGADNKISTLLTGVPVNTQVYRFVNGSFESATLLAFGWNPPAVGAATSLPGEGLFVRLPAAAAPVTITFVGEVPQGDLLRTPLPAGLSIVSSQVPQAGTADALGLPKETNQQVYQWDEATQGYKVSTFLGTAAAGFYNPPLSSLAVGEAFFLRRVTAGNWDRDFNVNE
jgi:hypothetical protein